jgi:hypothetical protein
MVPGDLFFRKRFLRVPSSLKKNLPGLFPSFWPAIIADEGKRINIPQSNFKN